MLDWNKVMYYAVKGNPAPTQRIEKTEEEWRKLLTEEEFRITRLKGTERAFTGEHCTSYASGVYQCTCCKTPLFDSSIKFDSNSGWPSFTQPITEHAVKYIQDTSHGMIRVEIVCNSCDAHLGHVFPDGPAPSGLRFCVNSVSIQLESSHE